MKTLLFLHGFMGTPTDGDFLKNLPSSVLNEYELKTLPIEGNLEELLNKLENIAPHIIYGYSLGGRIALQYLNKKNCKLDHLILESSSFGIANEKERSERFNQDTELAHKIKHDFKSFLGHWYSLPLWGQLGTKQKNELIQKRLNANTNMDVLCDQLLTFSQGILPYINLEEIDCKITYIAGSSDKKYTGLAKQLTCSKLIVQGSGHNVHAYHHGEIIRYLTEHVFI